MERTLLKPIVSAVSVFDPTKDFTFNFSYEDNQAIKNRAVVTDTSTYKVVYDKVQIGLILSHTIPANTLSVGKQYTISIQVFDNYGNSSALSDEVLFYCYSTPSFVFSNLPTGDYQNSNIDLSILFSQKEKETLKSCQFFMYSYDKTLINKSNTLFDVSSGNVNYKFSGLKNNEIYYFRAIGETLHGFNLDTGYCKVSVKYVTYPANLILSIENNKCNGYVSIDSNIYDVEYSVENNNYKFENGCVTLTNNSVTYKNLKVNGDFTLVLEAKELPLGTFLKIGDNISLSIICSCGIYYCRFKANNYTICKTLPKARLVTTNGEIIVNDEGRQIEISDTNYDSSDMTVFELTRKDGVFGLRTYYKADYIRS